MHIYINGEKSTKLGWYITEENKQVKQQQPAQRFEKVKMEVECRI